MCSDTKCVSADRECVHTGTDVGVCVVTESVSADRSVCSDRVCVVTECEC